jgi:hypothetical protein
VLEELLALLDQPVLSARPAAVVTLEQEVLSELSVQPEQEALTAQSDQQEHVDQQVVSVIQVLSDQPEQEAQLAGSVLLGQ